MEKVNTHAGNVRLVGERLCLDFCNTVDDYHQEQFKEYLLSYEHLLLWSQHSGALAPAEVEQLARASHDKPDRASLILERARRLRSVLYRIFSALAQGKSVQSTDLELLNQMLAETPARTALLPAEHGFSWEWAAPAEALDRMLWPVIWSAAQLLTSPELGRLKQCEGTGCSWLFLDTSRSRSRRWCSMQDCGNRAKVNRHYWRHQAN